MAFGLPDYDFPTGIRDINVEHGTDTVNATTKTITLRPAAGEIWLMTTFFATHSANGTDTFIRINITDGTNSFNIFRVNGAAGQSAKLFMGRGMSTAGYQTDYLNLLNGTALAANVSLIAGLSDLYLSNTYYLEVAIGRTGAGDSTINWHIQTIQVNPS